MPLTDWAIVKLLLTCCLAFSLLAQAPGPKPRPVFKVAIDAGHGGDDRGARGQKGLTEKEAAMAIALELKRSLEGQGFQVLMTRKDTAFVPLWERAKLANEAGADLFLSLHLNAARARGAKGSEVYFLSLGKSDEDSDAVAALENAGAEQTPGSDNVVEGILDDLAQKAYLKDSERLAVALLGQLNKVGNVKQRGVKQAPFIVLRGAAMPAVLVESAFISNPKEEAKLKEPAFRKKIAEAITKGVQRFIAEGYVPIRRKAVNGNR
jgi:N-acetylmuramoyl-L-alanine amidase